jgi:hypothetical protein
MERIQRLPKGKQRFVMEMIDTVLAQQDRAESRAAKGGSR